MDQDEAGPPVEGDVPPMDVLESTAVNSEAQDTPAKPLSPNPHILSLQHVQPSAEEANDVLDASLKPLDANMDAVVDVGVPIDADDVDVEDLHMSTLGPDGLEFENVHNLDQVEEGDSLLGGSVMNSSADPFSEQITE